MFIVSQHVFMECHRCVCQAGGTFWKSKIFPKYCQNSSLLEFGLRGSVDEFRTKMIEGNKVASES